MILPFVHGDTSPKRFRILSGGVGEPLTGKTVTAKLVDRLGVEKDTAGDVTIIDDGTASNAGLVDWTPDASDIDAAGSPYDLRFYVTSGGVTKPFPDGKPVTFEVYKP